MTTADPPRPQLKIRRINLDTGRENVVVISSRSQALRPEVFRGFSRVELRRDSKVLLATLLLTDDGLVGADEIGLSEPAFRRFGEAAGSFAEVTPATRPVSLDSVRAKIQGHTLSAPQITAIIEDIYALPLFRHGNCGVFGRLRQFHVERRIVGDVGGDGAGRHAFEMGPSDRRRQALHRRHSRQPHLDDRGADRRRAWASDTENLVACHYLAGRHRRHHGSAGARRPQRR